MDSYFFKVLYFFHYYSEKSVLYNAEMKTKPYYEYKLILKSGNEHTQPAIDCACESLRRRGRRTSCSALARRTAG